MKIPVHYNNSEASAFEDGFERGREHDDPELDGTDFAHPAWWRGSDVGVDQTVRVLNKILTGEDKGQGCLGYPPLESLRQALLYRTRPVHPLNMPIAWWLATAFILGTTLSLLVCLLTFG